MLKVGVIGCGYWGPNLIRNFVQLNESDVLWVADVDQGRLERMKKLYPGVETTTDYMDILGDARVDIVAVATPVRFHYDITHKALMAGKHVFVEKPMTSSVKEANELISLAAKKKLKLMVGHTFLYTSAVCKMKEIVDLGELGDIYYISSQRLNLGLFQQDINVLWDLAPHDLSIILYLLNRKPHALNAFGTSHINPAVEDVAVLCMRFEENIVAFVNVSWLDPDKVRRITVVGSKKMMVFDDVQPSEKIRIYDKSCEKPKHYDTFAEFPYSYKYGDIVIPKLDGTEPLKTELSHFLDCVQNDLTPISDGENGRDVIEILEAADISLQTNNSLINLGEHF